VQNGERLLSDPARNCTVKGRRGDWDCLPGDKSLFHSRPGSGLPIGNLTSQVFADFYLSPFDHFTKREHPVDPCTHTRPGDAETGPAARHSAAALRGQAARASPLPASDLGLPFPSCAPASR